MNLPQVYMCSPSWTLLPPPASYHPSRSSQCTSPRHPVLCIEPGLATCFIHDIIHVSMPFSQIIPPLPLPQSPKDCSIHHCLLLSKVTLEFCLALQLAAAAKSLQLCPTLCDPIDGNPPGSPVPGILQARTLEWGAIAFSNAWKWKVKVKSLSHVRPLTWTAAYQAPLSIGFSRQEYWSGVPLPSPALQFKWE